LKTNIAEKGQAIEAACTVVVDHNQANPKRKYFKWTPKMIEDLIKSIDLYKASMEY